MDSVCKLVERTRVQDEYGVWKESLTYKEVFCDVGSVSKSEFFDGGRSGLNPQMRFDVFHGDYNGEPLVEYEGKTYAVYRTFKPQTSDYIELYVQREGGTNGKQENSP